MRGELIEMIHHPERDKAIPPRALDVGFRILPDIPGAIGLNERSVADAEFHMMY